MRVKSLDQVATHLAKQPTKSLRAARRAVMAGTPETAPRAPGLEVRAQQPPPPTVDILVRFVPSPDDLGHPGLQPRHPGPRAAGAAVAIDGLSPKDIKAVRALEPRLLRWLRASKENRVRFYADPVGALDSAGIAIDDRLRRIIARARARSLRDRGARPPVAIGKIRVVV